MVDFIKKFGIPAIIFLGCICFYPLAFSHIFMDSGQPYYFIVFSPEILALLCLAMIFLKTESIIHTYSAARYIIVLILLFIAVEIFHFYYFAGYNFSFLVQSLLWVLLPYCVYLNYEGFKKLLPYLLIFFWIAVMLTSFREFLQNRLHYGIPGNFNWNAALGIVSSVVLSGYIFTWIKQKKADIPGYVLYPIASVPLICGIILIFRCGSKGALLGGVVAIALFFGFELKGIFRKIYLKAGFAIAIAGIIAISLFYKPVCDRVLPNDLRIHIWEGAIHLIADYWPAGTSQPGFESVFAEYMPESYYTKWFSTSRNNHPHNHFLFMFSTMGIIVGTAWFIMVVYPLVRYFQDYDNPSNNFRRKTMMICFVILLVHGMLDLVLFQWPTSYIFLIILGLLWHNIWPPEPLPEKTTGPNIFPVCKYVCIVFSITVIIYMSYELFRNISASSHFRNGLGLYAQNEFGLAAVEFDEAINIQPRPYYIYRASSNLFYKLHDFQDAYQTFSRLDNQLNRNYAHNNLILGQICLVEKRPADAVKFFQQEIRNYPLGVNGSFYLHLAQKELGRKMEADLAFNHTKYALKKKGLNLRYLPFLLKNPHYDDIWYAINSKTLKKYQVKAQ